MQQVGADSNKDLAGFIPAACAYHRQCFSRRSIGTALNAGRRAHARTSRLGQMLVKLTSFPVVKTLKQLNFTATHYDKKTQTQAVRTGIWRARSEPGVAGTV